MLLADHLETGESRTESMARHEMESNLGVTDGEIGARRFSDVVCKRGG